MTESSHDLVAAKADRIWDILRVVHSKREDAASRLSDESPDDGEGYVRPTWGN